MACSLSMTTILLVEIAKEVLFHKYYVVICGINTLLSILDILCLLNRVGMEFQLYLILTQEIVVAIFM